MRAIKCFTKESIRAANKIAKRRNYNRQLTDQFVRSLPDDKWFPIIFSMMHEHVQGKKVEPHIRCWVVFNEKDHRAFIDCDIDIYESLTSFNIPEEKDVANNA